MNKLVFVIVLPLLAEMVAATEAQQALPLASINDLVYKGGIRLKNRTYGDSRVGYTAGRMSLHQSGQSFYFSSHTQHSAVAQFPIPELNGAMEIENLPMIEPVQDFKRIIPKAPSGNPDNLTRITGMEMVDGELWINFHEHYDANADNVHTTLILENPSDLEVSNARGFLELESRAKGAGWISEIPLAWQQLLGGTHLFGHSSGDSIISRFSVGPSAYSVTPSSNELTMSSPQIDTNTLLEFSTHNPLHQDLYNESRANDIWTHVSYARFGFVIPGTRTYATFGYSGGHESGVGYKIEQSNGNVCGGYCTFNSEDSASYYWLWDVNDLLDVKEGRKSSYAVAPYSYGEFTIPLVGSSKSHIIGGDYDSEQGLLYLTVDKADELQSQYESAPVVIVYEIGEPLSWRTPPAPPGNIKVQ